MDGWLGGWKMSFYRKFQVQNLELRSNLELPILVFFKMNKKIKQAGAELGQAQLSWG